MISEWLVRNVTYPLHERLKGQRTVEAFSRVRGRDRWSPEDLMAHQLDRLRHTITRAYERSSFYRSRFDEAGVSPGDLRSLDDLARFPLIDKSHLRRHREEMLVVGDAERSQLVKMRTSGSTGEPTIFYSDRQRIAHEWAVCWRARSWWGLDWGDRWFWLWGSKIELSSRKLVKKIRNRLLNRELLSSYKMSDALMASYVRRWRRCRPRYMYAYSSSAYLLARYILEQEVDLSPLAPRVIFTTADQLYPQMRETIERAFHSPVAEEYGSRDGGFVAHECPEGRSLHVHADRVVLELVAGDRPAAPGELGEIVLTLLDAVGLPLIRFRTGDLARPATGSCPCGRSLPVISSIEGRQLDMVQNREGQLIHAFALLDSMEDVEGLHQFRIIQEEHDRLVVEMVMADEDQPIPEEVVKTRMEKAFGHPLRVEFRRVESVQIEGSGKHRLVVSRITGSARVPSDSSVVGASPQT